MALSVWAANGAQVPASMGRVLAYVASGGARGVADSGDLKVTALGTPTSKVQIAPGGALIPSKYSVTTQSYVVSETTTAQLNVAATSSGAARNDLVIVRVRDADFESGATGAEFTIIQGVAASVIANRTAAVMYCKTLNYPAEPLAGLTIPASTGTITTAMITDLRAVANPRRDVGFWVGLCNTHETLNSTSDIEFPKSAHSRMITIPDWATHVSVRWIISGLNLSGGDSVSYLKGRLGALATEQVQIDAATTADGLTTTIMVSGYHDVRAYQGQTLHYYTEAHYTSGAGRITATKATHLSFDYIFEAKAA